MLKWHNIYIVITSEKRIPALVVVGGLLGHQALGIRMAHHQVLKRSLVPLVVVVVVHNHRGCEHLNQYLF